VRLYLVEYPVFRNMGNTAGREGLQF